MKQIKSLTAYLPVAVLITAMLYTIYTTAVTNIVFTSKHQLGVAALLLCVIFAFIDPRKGKIALLFTLVLGVFDLIGFTPVTMVTKIWVQIIVKSPTVPFQHFSCWVFLLFVIVNVGSLRRLRDRVLQPKVYPGQDVEKTPGGE